MLTKTEFISKVRQEASKVYAKNDVKDIVNTTLDVIMKTVAKGESIQIVGFGTFEAAERSERCGRNPQTGEAMTIATKKIPKFKPGKPFKDMVAAGK